MRFPIISGRGRRFRMAFLFLFANLAAFYILFFRDTPEVRAVKRQLGMPLIVVPWQYYFILIGSWCVVYMLLFKLEERRDWYIFSAFALSGLLCVALLNSFWWAALAAQAVMVTVMLIGQLYFVRDNDRRLA